jgi:pyruvate dehydrogenase E2 component (dihydrolipoamide acetyltransferase)
MPEVAANATEAVVADWPVPENTPYAAQDAIVTVETEKAVVDVSADAAGVILKTLVSAGDGVQIGDPIAVLGEPDEVVNDLADLLVSLGVGQVRPSATPSRPSDTTRPVGPPAGERTNGTARIFSSPLARRVAEAAGLALADIAGTGPGGRVVRRDVTAAVAGLGTPAPVPVAAEVGAAATEAVRGAPEARPPSSPAYVDQQHSRMRRAIADRLSAANRDVPTFTIEATARVDRLLKMRDRLNAHASTRISVTDLIALAVARTHVLVPAMNVVWTSEAVRSFTGVDVALAVATERGVVTPVLRGVDTMRVTEVASASRDLVERARAGRLRQDEIEGGTITVTNLGPFGTEAFTAVINPPQSAILAVGAARREPLVRRDRVIPGTVIRMTLTVDHRPVDGAVAAEWMAALRTRLEEPLSILA